MSSDLPGRQLLPQTAQMQSFMFAPPALAPRENQRNYVFVDEHNRHKRLKVMRACEGCRRRKIKCDAATTNSWPCAACIRLKLSCIPPAVSYDKDFDPNSQSYELEAKAVEHVTPDTHSQHGYQHHMIAGPPALQHMPTSLPSQNVESYHDRTRLYQPVHQENHSHRNSLPYTSIPNPSQHVSYQPQPLYPEDGTHATPAVMTMTPPATEGTWTQEPTSSLTDALGELQIGPTAVASYITNQRKTLAETPAQEELEIQLPSCISSDHMVRIPKEMMPSEEQALQCLDYFFTNIHPYLPVVNKTYFYQQWQNARESISPLLLEAMFACANLMMGNDTEGHQWLALAAKHEESFKDVPRLSTMQAMLLLLKARESSPKRGYFWRSWMTVVGLITMGKDLELDEHLEQHREDRSCDSIPHECLTKFRVWHMVFILEVMVGGPQGRSDLLVDSSTVDFEMPKQFVGLDASEIQISRQFTQYLRVLKNIQLSLQLHGKFKKKKSAGWALEPNFVSHNSDWPMWLRGLPEDMQIAYPADGSPPWVTSHFIANMHSHYHLGVIMHLRPQLAAIPDKFDGVWKQHMMTCYTAAKSMCKLQEAVLKTYGLPGLMCMLRGMSFTIYAVLTCTMLHLVAITCPDAILNRDAREFFVRHMRILETCSPSWPMPEVRQQIDTLRHAFSADISKPFDLKITFPFGSPQVPTQSTPSSTYGSYRSRLPSQQSPIESSGQPSYFAQPISPPISTSEYDTQADSHTAQSLMMATGQQTSQPLNGIPLQEPVHWNPQPIFDQWNVAFGTPSAAASQSSPPLRQPPPGPGFDSRSPQDMTAASYPISTLPSANGLDATGSQLPMSGSYVAPTQPNVTPSMWQQVVASAYPESLKRSWTSASPGMADHHIYKRAR